MKRLFVAGDSFASLCRIQEPGNSWSEILASKLEAELINLARPGASNTAIAIQIDYITEKVDIDDYVVVFLTSHNRATLPNNTITTNKPLLERFDVAPNQVPYSGIEYSNTKSLITSLFTDDSAHKETQEYYKKYFDPDLAYFTDRMIIAGAMKLLSDKNDNFIVLSGGFKVGSSRLNLELSANEIGLNEHHFINHTWSRMLGIGENADYVNHMNDVAHSYLASFLYKKIA